jgi:hypothetical protein
MSIIKVSSNMDRPKDKAVRHFGHRSSMEMDMRDVLESWARKQWPAGRIIHELVISSGVARADVATILPDHFVAFEIKGPADSTVRLLHQCAFFRLATPELWLVSTEHHEEDCEVIRYLIPSIGVIMVRGLGARYGSTPDPANIHIEIKHKAEPYRPLGKALLSMLWVEELRTEAIDHHLIKSKSRGTHSWLVKTLDEKLTDTEKMTAVCRHLRARDFVYRSDAPEWRSDNPVTTEEIKS